MNDINSTFGVTNNNWTCPHCNAINPLSNTICGRCENYPNEAIKYQNIDKTPTYNAENTLSTFSMILLILGLLSAFIVLVVGLTMLGKNSTEDLGLLLIIISLIIGVGTVFNWSLLKVIANISITLKEIKEKIK